MIGVGLEIWDEQPPQVVESNNNRGKKDVHTTKVNPDSYAQFVNALRYSQDIARDNVSDSNNHNLAPQTLNAEIQHRAQHTSPTQTQQPPQVRYSQSGNSRVHQPITTNQQPQFTQPPHQFPQLPHQFPQAPVAHQSNRLLQRPQPHNQQFELPVTESHLGPLGNEEDCFSNSSSTTSRRRREIAQKIKKKFNIKNLISEVKILKQMNTFLIIFLVILIIILCFKK